MWLASLLACATPATVVNWCDENPDGCPPCTSDAECVFQGNACTETVYCAHEDAEIAVVMIGCSEASEHPWPDPLECMCGSGGVCEVPRRK